MSGQSSRTVGALEARIAELEKTLAARETYIKNLEQAITKLRRWQFGTKSEQIHDDQMLFDFYGRLESAREEAVEWKPSKETAPRKPAKRGRRAIPPDLPRQTVLIDLDEHEKKCPGCGALRVLIGHDKSEQIDWNAASFFVRVFLRAKYACEPCQAHVTTAASLAPTGPIAGGLPGSGLLSQVIVSKYCDHQPCYRQSRIYARHGLFISRSTLCDWIGQAEKLLAPIVEAMRKDILASGILRTDDTIVRLWVPGLRRTIQARMWGYLGDREHNQVVYEFSKGRSQEYPLAFLRDYQGRVQADAFSGYDKLFLDGTREELGCMAHCRRHFFDARDSDPERVSVALGFIRDLYIVEHQARELSPEARVSLRRRQARPILDAWKRWLDAECLKVLSKSPIAQAIGYALGNWEALTRYVGIGEADIDNNAMERALRGIVLGRKNFLFVASEAGGRWAATAYSLIESCKLNGIDPYRYLKDVLMRVWTHPAKRVHELMPRLWRPPPDSS